MKTATKTLALLLALLLAFSMVFTACSEESTDNSSKDTNKSNNANDDANDDANNNANDDANENAGNNATVPDSYGKVTKEEWIDAFDLTDVNSLTVYLKEVDEDETIELSGKYYKNIFVGVSSRTENGKREDDPGKQEIKLTDFEPFFGELIYELRDFDDYGYSLFTYSEETKSYTAKMEVDIPNVDVNISFNNKNVAKVTLYGVSNDPQYGSGINFYAEFSKYNSTTFDDADKERYIINEEQWKAAFDLSDVDELDATVSEIDDGEEKRYLYYYSDKTLRVQIYTYENGKFQGRNMTEETVEQMSFEEFHGINEFIREIDDLDNFGFSLFKFSDETLSYTATMEVDIPNVTVSVSFEEGKISSIRLKGESDDPGFGNVDISFSIY